MKTIFKTKKRAFLHLIFLSIFALFSCENQPLEEAQDVAPEKKEWRIVSLNGTITELLYELDLGDQLVGRDVTSTYPKATEAIPNLGHVTQLNAEAILALKPNLILVDDEQKSNKVLESLKEAGIAIEILNMSQDLNAVIALSKQLGQVLDQKIETTALEKRIEQNLEKVAAMITNQGAKPKVLFIYARGAQTLMVAGKNTFAEKMVELAGGSYIAQEFESFKPLTPEALLEYQPDVLLLFDSGLASLGDEEKGISGAEALWTIPGMAQVPAGKNKSLITMDGLLLSGFGPRASEALVDLATALHAFQNTDHGK